MARKENRFEQIRPDLNRVGLKLIKCYYQDRDEPLGEAGSRDKINFFLEKSNGLTTPETIQKYRNWLKEMKTEMKISHKKYRAPILILVIIATIPLVVNILRLISAFTQVFIWKKYQDKSLKLIFVEETSKIYVDQRGLHKSENWGIFE